MLGLVPEDRNVDVLAAVHDRPVRRQTVLFDGRCDGLALRRGEGFLCDAWTQNDW